MTQGQFIKDITSGAEAMGVPLTKEAAERLFVYCSELERWNRKVNLVSRQPGDWLRIHFLDSLAPLGLGLVGEGARVVDLGAGAGFPGVPLQVARPDIAVALAEASGKKCAWLKHVVRVLGLPETRVLEGRFEDTLRGGWGGRFDLAVSRAAAKPGKIVHAAGPFLAPGGRILVYTTRALVEKGAGTVHPYRVPGSRVPSVIWEVEK